MKRGVFLLVLLVCFAQIEGLPFPVYDKTEALTYVLYSDSAYCLQPNLAAWNCQYCKGDTAGFVFVNYFESDLTDSHVYIGYHPNRDEIIVSFRGSLPLSIENWLDDIEYFQSNGPFNGVSTLVHDGFLKSYQAVASQVIAELQNLTAQFPHYNIVLTGHSLGGAQATLLAMDLYYNFRITDAYLITFGSPRVGNADFATAFNGAYAGRSWRVTNQDDIVPHVPPQIAFPYWYHAVGSEVWYKDSQGDIYVDNGSGEDPNGSDSNWFDLSLTDHLTYGGILLLGCGQL